MKFALLIVIILSASILNAQSIPDHPNLSDSLGRQGAWTILFDAQWNIIQDESVAVYYRTITYKDDQPISKARDYWCNGDLQMEADITTDRPNDIYDGEVTYYLPGGELENLIYFSNGNPEIDKTESHLIQMIEKEPDRDELFSILGLFYHEFKRDKVKSEDYLTQYINRLKTKKQVDTYKYASALRRLAWVYLRHFDYKKCEPLFLEAHAFFKKNKDQYYPIYVETLVELGDMFRYMGRPETGLSYLNQALNEFEQNPSEMTFPKLIILNNISICHSVNGKLDQAIAIQLEVVKECEKFYGGDHREIANTYGNLAEFYFLNNQYDMSEKYYVKSSDMLERLFGRGHQEFLMVLNSMANIKILNGDYSAAESMYKESYEGLARLTSANDATVVSTKRLYAFTLYAQNKKQQANDILRTTALETQLYIESYFDYLSEPARVAFVKNYQFDDHKTWIVKEHQEHPELLSDMLNMQLRNKGLLLSTTNKIKQRIVDSGDRQLIKLYDESQVIRQKLGTMSSLTREQVLKDYGIDKDSLQLVYEQIDRQLNQLSSMYASENKITRWQDVQVKLGKGEALVEIVRYSEADLRKLQSTSNVKYVGLIITSKSKNPKLIELTDGNYLETKGINLYQNSISHQIEDQKSYDSFWQPLQKHLKGIKKLYLSLDGVYNKVNIQALKNPAKDSYVMDEMDVHMITSGRDLLEDKPDKLPLKYGLLLGNPAFGESLNNEKPAKIRGYDQILDQTQRAGISNLPGAEKEVKTIQKIFKENGWRELTLVNETADERALKEMLKPNVLHIATHGFFQSDTTQNKHPLYKSGLLLSGAAKTISDGADFTGSANEVGEDGILTSFEAMNLNIDNTNLVVLSACETGLGEVVNGEGVYGLQRAFKIAGARTILMSLWKVDDKSTQELMVKFYTNLLSKGMSKRQSLSMAQHDMKEKYPHPYYWGAFVMLGE